MNLISDGFDGKPRCLHFFEIEPHARKFFYEALFLSRNPLDERVCDDITSEHVKLLQWSIDCKNSIMENIVDLLHDIEMGDDDACLYSIDNVRDQIIDYKYFQLRIKWLECIEEEIRKTTVGVDDDGDAKRFRNQGS